MKVTFTQESLKPTLAAEYKEFIPLLPDALYSARCKVSIEGVLSSLPNALRRIISCEMPVKVLEVQFENVSTNEKFIIQEMIIKRISAIPILQSVPENATFSLKVQNNGVTDLDVKSGDIVFIGPGPTDLEPTSHKNKKFFNSTFTICTLSPGTFLNITDIKIATYYGWQKGYAVNASNVTSTVSPDIKLFNIYNNTDGLKSANQKVKNWELKFITCGSMEPSEIVKSACSILTERLLAVKNAEYAEYAAHTEVLLRNETHTIGNLLMQHINEMFDAICTYKQEDTIRGVKLIIRGADVREILDKVTKDIIKMIDFVARKV